MAYSSVITVQVFISHIMELKFHILRALLIIEPSVTVLEECKALTQIK